MKPQNKIFGINTREAYERVMAEPEEEKKTERTNPIPSNVTNADAYLILPGRKYGNYEYPDLLVATERTYNGNNWNQAHESLRQEGSLMLTIRQYVDFLNLLKSGKAHDGKGNIVAKSRLDGILDEIVTVRNPWRAEWLDAKFSSKGTLRKDWYVEYHNPRDDGAVNEQLEDCLRNDKTPGIDLDYWLQNATAQGLPPKNNPDGSLYYYHPRDGRVAGFYASSVRAVLYCDWNLANSDSSLGVRAAKIKA